jgi:defect-in-organelle-trafficking protein DotD
MVRMFPKLCILSGLLAFTACSDALKVDRPQLVASPDKVSLMLAEAADRAADSLETLAAVEQARAPTVSVSPINNAPPELRRAMTVNWIGPVEPITKMLADRAGYVFHAIGNPPPVPLVVTIDAENQPVIETLRSLGLQLGARADVRVDSAARMIELHYAPVSGIGG